MRHVLISTLMCLALAGGVQAMERAPVLDMVNQYRAAKGAEPLRYSRKLEAAARRHARDMLRGQFFSHRGSNGSNVGQRVRAQGYGFCFVAENIAMGQRSLGDVMQAWVTSKGHRRNLLDRRAAEVALVRADRDIWVMVLGRPGC